MRKRVTLMVVAVTVIFGICWGTASVVYVLHYTTSYNIGFVPIACANIMILFNSAVNPFVYALLNQGEGESNDILLLFRPSEGASFPKTSGLRACQQYNQPDPPDSHYRTFFLGSGSVVSMNTLHCMIHARINLCIIWKRYYWILYKKKQL